MSAQAIQAVPITEHEDIKKIFALYLQNGMGQEKADAESLIKHIAFMETQFEKVFDELQNVRSQLQTIEDKSVRATVTRIVDAAHTKITEAKAQFSGIKDSVVASFSDAVAAAKEKGVSALKKTVDFLKIQPALSIIRNKLGQAIHSLHQGVAQIEKVKTELHAAKSHAHNAGRLMLGKDVKAAKVYDSERGVLAGVQKLMNKTVGLLAGIGKAAGAAMRKIEELGQQSEKTSVHQSIKDIKDSRAGGGRLATDKSRDNAR